MLATMVGLGSSAYAEVPGDGRPVALMVCPTMDSANIVAANLVQRPADINAGCWAIAPFYPTDLSRERLVLGPLVDFEGDAFAVFEVNVNDGRVVYPFIWWGGPQFSPIGWKI